MDTGKCGGKFFELYAHIFRVATPIDGVLAGYVCKIWLVWRPADGLRFGEGFFLHKKGHGLFQDLYYLSRFKQLGLHRQIVIEIRAAILISHVDVPYLTGIYRVNAPSLVNYPRLKSQASAASRLYFPA